MKFYVIGDRQTVLGFRLVGIEGTDVAGRDEALDALGAGQLKVQLTVPEVLDGLDVAGPGLHLEVPALEDPPLRGAVAALPLGQVGAVEQHDGIHALQSTEKIGTFRRGQEGTIGAFQPSNRSIGVDGNHEHADVRRTLATAHALRSAFTALHENRPWSVEAGEGRESVVAVPLPSLTTPPRKTFVSPGVNRIQVKPPSRLISRARRPLASVATVPAMSSV